MGVFWNAAVFKKQNRVDVWEIVKQLAAGENEFYILLEECALYDCEGGTIITFNEYCSVGDGFLAKALSQRLEGPVLVCSIYDDSFWDYYLYKEGQELDKFMTVPDCFEPIAEEEWEQWRGNAALLAEEFGCSAETLSEHLYFWKDEEGDAWEVVDFLEALGFKIPDCDDTIWEEDELENFNDCNSMVQETYTSDWESLYSARRNVLECLANKSKGKSPVGLTTDVKIDMKFVVWIRVCKNGLMQQLSAKELTPEQIVQMMDETVYSPYHSTLVLHQGSGNFACLFFAGDSLCYYELIGNFISYYYVDTEDLRMFSVGNVMLSEEAVFQERTGIDRALRILFSNVEYADKYLKNSSFWSARNVFPGGRNNYNRRRRELGLLED